ncbi:PxKF domain-containing protein [Streptomyces sp. NBC_01017]|uniref:PxKF domain-containing protein n=1 Tax=Streptomyces sp. NBC_01017 TaxID=2903721 RepID=UPI0038643FF1|nr:PxKF domain-containing protein [Streptomyces sp. NBC_01017]WSV34721.1 PxKF domain-containing protein [Streptomyces sp. NBC_01017]
MTSSASAADGPCETAGHTVTCTYTGTGTEQSLTLPDTVDTVDITATGAAGGDATLASTFLGAGGRGAIVDAHDVPVTDAAVTGHQRTLYVMVGGRGVDGKALGGGGEGGFNGGGGNPQAGSTYAYGGGGGGASDVRTKPASVALTEQDSRLVVAGGGGGAGRRGGQGGTAAGPGGINDYESGYGGGLDGQDGGGFGTPGGDGADSSGVFSNDPRTGGEGGGGGDPHVAGGGGGASPDSYVNGAPFDGGPGGGGGGTTGGKAGQPWDSDYSGDVDATDGTLGQGGNSGVIVSAAAAGGGGGYYGGGPGGTEAPLSNAGGGGAGSSYSVTLDATVVPVPADNPVPSQVVISYTVPDLEAVFTDSLPAAKIGDDYSHLPITGPPTGGTAPYAYTATGLPDGLDIDPDTGLITGTPTGPAADDQPVTVTVTDAGTGSLQQSVTSQDYTLDVNKADSSTTLSSSQNPSAPGESVVLTAHVDSNTASPGGDVVFSRTGSSTPLGTAPVEAGSASFTVPAASLNAGDNAFTAAYQGDSTHNGSAGEIVQRVQYTTTDPFFLSPIDPDAVNLLKAGQAVPVKFTLDGNQGMNVIAAGYPRYTRTACTSEETVDLTDETTTSQAGLTYDNGTYSYAWKTKKDWAGQCGTLNIKLADNTTHTIQVRFK